MLFICVFRCSVALLIMGAHQSTTYPHVHPSQVDRVIPWTIRVPKGNCVCTKPCYHKCWKSHCGDRLKNGPLCPYCKLLVEEEWIIQLRSALEPAVLFPTGRVQGMEDVLRDWFEEMTTYQSAHPWAIQASIEALEKIKAGQSYFTRLTPTDYNSTGAQWVKILIDLTIPWLQKLL